MKSKHEWVIYDRQALLHLFAKQLIGASIADLLYAV